jgi:hypothetical protein
MRSIWRLIGLSAVLAGALTASPAIAGEDTDTPKQNDIASIQARLDRAVGAIQALRLENKELREDLNFERTVKIASLERDIRELKQEMVKLTEELARLRTSTSARTAYYAGPGPNVPTGIIKLRNTWVEPVTITINNRPYDVPAGGELSLTNQPAGEFVYEVLGIQPPVRRTLAANKTFDINVYSR